MITSSPNSAATSAVAARIASPSSGLIAGSREPTLADVSPQLRGDVHEEAGNGQEFERRLELVEPLEATRCLGPEQLAPDLVTGDLRNRDPVASSQ